MPPARWSWPRHSPWPRRSGMGERRARLRCSSSVIGHLPGRRSSPRPPPARPSRRWRESPWGGAPRGGGSATCASRRTGRGSTWRAAALAAIPGRRLASFTRAGARCGRWSTIAGLHPRGAVLRADLELDRSLAALIVGDLSARGLRVRVAKRPPGWLTGRLALIGCSVGGGRRAGRRAAALRAPHPAPDIEEIVGNDCGMLG